MTPSEYYADRLNDLHNAIAAGEYMTTPQLDIPRIEQELAEIKAAVIVMIHSQAADNGG